MAHRKNQFQSSKAAASKNISRRRRNQYFRNFRKKRLDELKEALNDRLCVARVKWELHYLTVDYICGKPKEIYGNLTDAKRILRSRLFYPTDPHTFVNLYFFKEIREDADGKFLVFPDKLKENAGLLEEKTEKLIEKLIEKSENDLIWLTNYLLGDQRIQDAKRLSR